MKRNVSSGGGEGGVAVLREGAYIDARRCCVGLHMGGGRALEKKNMCDTTFPLQSGSELTCCVRRLGEDFSGPV